MDRPPSAASFTNHDQETNNKVTVVISPGLGNSDSGHWQTVLERKFANVIRVEQADWESPGRATWMAAVEKTLADIDGPVILVGHSCGSIAIIEWANEYSTDNVVGALLVAPADVEADTALEAIKPQAPLPMNPLPFPALVVCSDNDIHMSLSRSLELSSQWGCSCLVLENAGHINTDSGFGDWQQGEALIESLIEAPVLVPRTQ